MKSRIVSILMSSCFILATLTACGWGEENSSTKQEATSSSNVICSFESVEEILTLSSGEIFGKKVYSTDEKYVTHGNACMYMEIETDFQYISRESIYGIDSREEFIEPHLKFEGTKFDFGDTKGVYGFAIDIYNANDKDIPVELTMETSIDGAESYFDMGSQVALKGEGKTLYFIADAETMSYKGIYDLISVIVTFPFTDGDEGSLKLYVDNFRMLRGDNGNTVAYSYENQMLCGFEDSDILKRITASSFFTVKDYWAKTSLNQDMIYVTEGNSSLKLTRGFSNYETEGRSGKSMVTLSNANFFKNTSICNLSEEELKHLVIKVDVYNDSDKTEMFEWFIGPRIKESICLFKVQNVPPKTWTTLEISVAERLEYNKKIAEEAGKKYIQIDLRELFMNFAFHFSFKENQTNNVITTYVDNLRYEFV